jgi:hypothetical protein
VATPSQVPPPLELEELDDELLLLELEELDELELEEEELLLELDELLELDDEELLLELLELDDELLLEPVVSQTPKSVQALDQAQPTPGS